MDDKDVELSVPKENTPLTIPLKGREDTKNQIEKETESTRSKIERLKRDLDRLIKEEKQDSDSPGDDVFVASQTLYPESHGAVLSSGPQDPDDDEEHDRNLFAGTRNYASLRGMSQHGSSPMPGFAASAMRGEMNWMTVERPPSSSTMPDGVQWVSFESPPPTSLDTGLGLFSEPEHETNEKVDDDQVWYEAESIRSPMSGRAESHSDGDSPEPWTPDTFARRATGATGSPSRTRASWEPNSAPGRPQTMHVQRKFPPPARLALLGSLRPSNSPVSARRLQMPIPSMAWGEHDEDEAGVRQSEPYMPRRPTTMQTSLSPLATSRQQWTSPLAQTRPVRQVLDRSLSPLATRRQGWTLSPLAQTTRPVRQVLDRPQSSSPLAPSTSRQLILSPVDQARRVRALLDQPRNDSEGQQQNAARQIQQFSTESPRSPSRLLNDKFIEDDDVNA
jgi:hypothetical protein